MAGLKAGAPTPEALTVHEASRVLEVVFSDGARFRIPFELMRVYSPSAEVQGHGPGQDVLQTGKRDVTLVNLEPVGNYAVKPTFSDGHDSGIFSWDYLYELGQRQDALWAQYAERLAAAWIARRIFAPTCAASIDSIAACVVPFGLVTLRRNSVGVSWLVRAIWALPSTVCFASTFACSGVRPSSKPAWIICSIR